MSKRSGSTVSKISSGSPPSDYLTVGEIIKWQGKPAAIVILGRGVILTVFSLIYLFSMMIFNDDKENVLMLAIAVLACAFMILVERRLGLIGGLTGIAIAVLALISSNLDWYWFFMPMVFAFIALLINFLYLSRVMFVITDRRIISRYGIFTLRYADTGVNKIQNVTVIQPWYERIFGYGDIFFATAGEKGGIDYESPGIKLMNGGAVQWENVGNPFEVNKIAAAVVNPAAMPVMVVNQPVQRPAQSIMTASAQDRLRELEDLKSKGMITQQEFDEKRKQVIRNL